MARYSSPVPAGSSIGLPQPNTPRSLLDATSAPMLASARETLLAALDAGWADPRRLYAEGRRARAMLDQAREVVADGLGVRPPEVSFLPGGPVAVRTGLEGLRHAARRRGARLVASAIEHSAVLTAGRFHAAQAADPTLFAEVAVDRVGRLDLDAFAAAIGAPGTVLAAVQSANGEIGTRQPLDRAHGLCQAHGIPLLVDAAAGLGRDPVPERYDVLAGDARSWGGPPGVGVLVVPERTRWRRPGPVGEVEFGRGDSEPVVALALAAAEAWRQTAAVRDAEASIAAGLVDRLRLAAARVPDVEVVGDPVDRLPHVLTFSALYVDGEAVVSELDRRGFAVASGSACTASTLEPSHVLAALGVLTHGNVRVTLPLRAVAPDLDATVHRLAQELPAVIRAVRDQLGATGL